MATHHYSLIANERSSGFRGYFSTLRSFSVSGGSISADTACDLIQAASAEEGVLWGQRMEVLALGRRFAGDRGRLRLRDHSSPEQFIAACWCERQQFDLVSYRAKVDRAGGPTRPGRPDLGTSQPKEPNQGTEQISRRLRRGLHFPSDRFLWIWISELGQPNTCCLEAKRQRRVQEGQPFPFFQFLCPHRLEREYAQSRSNSPMSSC